jgi:hypothetical protein
MALTITDLLIGNADTPHTAGLGGGRWTVTSLPGHVLTEVRAAAMETAEAACQIPADCKPEVYDEGFWSRVDACAGQVGFPDPPPLCRRPRCPGPTDGLARGWIWRCRRWWSWRR